MADCFGAHGWGKELVGEAPVVVLGVADEDGGVVLHDPEGVGFADFLGEILGFQERCQSGVRAVGKVGGLAHVGGFDDMAVFAE